MSSQSVLENIATIINKFLENEPGYFLVEVKIKPTNNVKVFFYHRSIGNDRCIIAGCIDPFIYLIAG